MITSTGFTSIPNDILEHLISGESSEKITNRELRLLLCVCRQTFGFQRDSQKIRNDKFAQYTKICESNISKVSKALVNKNILRKIKGAWSVNKDVSTWYRKQSPVTKTAIVDKSKKVADDYKKQSPMTSLKKESTKQNNINLIKDDFYPDAETIRSVQEFNIDLQLEIKEFIAYNKKEQNKHSNWNEFFIGWCKRSRNKKTKPTTKLKPQPTEQQLVAYRQYSSSAADQVTRDFKPFVNKQSDEKDKSVRTSLSGFELSQVNTFVLQ